MAGAVLFLQLFQMKKEENVLIMFCDFFLSKLLLKLTEKALSISQHCIISELIHFLKTLKTFAWVRFLDNSSSNLCRITRTFISKSTNAYSRRSWKDWRRAFWAILDDRWEKNSQVRVSYLYFMDLEVIKTTQRNGFRSEIWRELSKKCKLQFKQVYM